MADVVAGLDTSRIPVKVSAVGELAGFEHYDDVVAAFSAEALDDEYEGREMLYKRLLRERYWEGRDKFVSA